MSDLTDQALTIQGWLCDILALASIASLIVITTRRCELFSNLTIITMIAASLYIALYQSFWSDGAGD